MHNSAPAPSANDLADEIGLQQSVQGAEKEQPQPLQGDWDRDAPDDGQRIDVPRQDMGV